MLANRWPKLAAIYGTKPRRYASSIWALRMHPVYAAKTHDDGALELGFLKHMAELNARAFKLCSYDYWMYAEGFNENKKLANYTGVDVHLLFESDADAISWKLVNPDLTEQMVYV